MAESLPNAGATTTQGVAPGSSSGVASAGGSALLDKSAVARHRSPPKPRPIADFDDQLWPIHCAILILAGILAGIAIAVSDFSDLRLLYNGWTRLGAVALCVVLMFCVAWWLQGKLRRRLLLAILVSLLVHLSALVYAYGHPLALAADVAGRQAVAPGELPDDTQAAVPDDHWAAVEQPDAEQSFDRPVETVVPEKTAPAAAIPQPQEEIEHDLPAVDAPKVFRPDTPKMAAAQPNQADLNRAAASAPQLLEKFAGEARQRQPGPAVEAPASEAQESAVHAGSDAAQRGPLGPSALAAVGPINPPKASRLAAASGRGVPDADQLPPAMTAAAQLPAAAARHVAALQQQAAGPDPTASQPGTVARASRGSNLPSLASQAEGDALLDPAMAGGSPGSRLEAVSTTAVTQAATAAPRGRIVAAAGTAEFGIGSGRIVARTGQPHATGTQTPALAAGTPAVRIARAPGGLGEPGRNLLAADASLVATEATLAAPGGGATEGPAGLDANVETRPWQSVGLPGNRQGVVRSGAIASLSDRGAPLPLAIARRAVASQPDGDGTGLAPNVSSTIARTPSGSNLPTATLAAVDNAGRGAGGLSVTEGGAASQLQIGPAAALGDAAAAAPLGRTTVSSGRADSGMGAAQVAALAGVLSGGSDELPRRASLVTPRLAVPGRPESLGGDGDNLYAVSSPVTIGRSEGTRGIDGVAHEPTESYRQRRPGRRGLISNGAEGYTNHAVELGLEFFARLQFPDGHWSLDQLPPGMKLEDAALGEMQSDSAATGLVLLGYLGAGYTHLDDKYRTEINRGIRALIAHQKPDGELFSGGTKYARLYSQGIATMALCEAYGMTQDPELREPASRAIAFILKAQDPRHGGWRYEPREESDTSVTGWQLMALKSAEMAGLSVPTESLRRIGTWLDYAEAPGESGRSVYNPQSLDTLEQREGRMASPAMTAEAMLMRMYLGRKRDDPSLVAGAAYLKANLPEVGTRQQPSRNCYYWYYATQAMFQMRGDYWTTWNNRLRPLIEQSQVQDGPWTGSWHPRQPVPDRWGSAGGRMYVTAMHVLMLEVYYRHLPLFQELGK